MSDGTADDLAIDERAGAAEFAVKVVPGASRTRLMGTWAAALKVAVSAPPEGGKANAAVVALLAEALSVKRADISIVSGQSQPLKRVRVAGLTADEVRERLAAGRQRRGTDK